MDHSSFDRIARLLGGATSRRSGMKAALGGLLGLGALAAADADAKSGNGNGKDTGKGKDRGTHDGHGHGHGKRRRKPAIEGPCGNGSRKDNICTKDSECCTGICNTRLGKKNKDKKGRCRCVRKGKPCKASKNCCNGMSCTGGTCGGGGGRLVPTGDPCVAGKDTCLDSKASCTTFDENSGGAAGTYCLLPILEKTCARAGDCTVNSCYRGVCLTCACGGCPPVDACDSPTVTSGGSIQTAINNAANDSTITIGPGTYVEDLTISGKSLTFVGCPDGANEVILKNATQGVRTIDVTDESNLTIGDIVIQGDNDIANSVSGGGVQANGGVVCIGMRSRIEGCARFGEKGGGVHAGENNASTLKDLIITDATIIQNNVSDSYGGGVYADDATQCAISGHVKILNNKAKYGGGVSIYYKAFLAVSGNVQITDNAADSYGGGVHFYSGGHSGPITIGTFGGKTLIARNTSANAAGGIAVEYGGDNETYIIEGDVVISDNTADSYAGGVYVDGSNLTIRGNAKLTGNKTTNPTSASDSAGGAIAFDAGNGGTAVLSIEGNVEISGNSAGKTGGAIDFDGPTLNLSGNATIKNNSSDSYGGGIYTDNSSAVITLSDAASITGNTATTGGGGIWADTSGVTVNGGSAVTGNSPTNCDGNGLTC